MTSTTPTDGLSRPGLLVGPGARASEVGRVLEVLSETRLRGASKRAPAHHLGDLEELLLGAVARATATRSPASDAASEWGRTGGDPDGEGGMQRGLAGLGEPGFRREGCLILEAGRVPLEDIGFVRRFLERSAGWRLVVLADDPTEGNAEALLRLSSSLWLPWPPNLDQLAELLDSPGVSASREPAPKAESSFPATPSMAVTGAREADPVPPPADRILSTGSSTDRFEPRPLASPPSPGPEESATIQDRGRPGFGHELQPPAEDLPRVRPSSNASATPPPEIAGSTELGGLVEEILAGDSLSGVESPRYLFRCDGTFPVAGERSALSRSLSGFLGLARMAAGPSGVVSVVVGPLADSRSALLRVDFPAGALGNTRIEELLERAESGAQDPQDTLGQALASAARSSAQLRAQGAEPTLSALEDGRLRLAVEFPPPVVGGGESGVAAATAEGGLERDPFA